MNSSAKKGLPTHEYEVISPAKAREYLKKNKVNRFLSLETVDRYARDIANGTWNYTMPLMFDVNGNLIDGQHRLNAIIKSDVELTLLVIRQVPEEAQATLDIGKQRNLVDELRITESMDEAYARQLVALARNVWRIKNGMVGNGMTLTPNELRQIMADHPELEASAKVGVRAAKEDILTDIAPSSYAAAHWMIAQTVGQEAADWYVDKVMTMDGQGRETPIGVLNYAVQQIRKQGKRFAHRDAISMLIKAWNATAEGKKVTRLFSKKRKGAKFALPKVSVPTVNYLGEASKKDAA